GTACLCTVARPATGDGFPRLPRPGRPVRLPAHQRTSPARAPADEYSWQQPDATNTYRQRHHGKVRWRLDPAVAVVGKRDPGIATPAPRPGDAQRCAANTDASDDRRMEPPAQQEKRPHQPDDADEHTPTGTALRAGQQPVAVGGGAIAQAAAPGLCHTAAAYPPPDQASKDARHLRPDDRPAARNPFPAAVAEAVVAVPAVADRHPLCRLLGAALPWPPAQPAAQGQQPAGHRDVVLA